MNISIFGLGYVGCVSLGCLAKNGHTVIGVDTNEIKVSLINIGKATIVEKDIDRIISESIKNKFISATLDARFAVLNTDISFICVGTPSTDQGHLNLDFIFATAFQIGDTIKEKNTFHTVVIRSTVLPGTNEKYGEIMELISGKKRNIDFAIVSNPEFLREGSAVQDYYNPPVTVIGTDSNRAFKIISDIYEKVNGPIERVEIRVAEIIKYVNNSYHALKIVYANEVGNICKKLEIDSHEVMKLFCMDTQLNISPYYFKPGFAYGGSCLPKDLKALKTLAHDQYIEVPVLNNIEKSNSIQKQNLIDIVKKLNKKNILILGISFKAGTDDLRYSPIVEVAESLIGQGYNIKLHDKNVNLSKLIGKNKSYIIEKLPHIEKYLLEKLDTAIGWSDIIIINNNEPEYLEIDFPEEKYIIDLCKINKTNKSKNHIGLCW